MAYTTCPDCKRKTHMQFGGVCLIAHGPHASLEKFGITIVGNIFYRQCPDCKESHHQQVTAWENEGGRAYDPVLENSRRK